MSAPTPLRVAVVTATFPPYLAGTGNLAFAQAEVLARHGHHVTVFTSSQPGAPVDPPGVRVVRSEPVLRIGNAPLIPGLARLRGFDLLYLFQPFIFGSELVALAARSAGVPLVSYMINELLATGLRGLVFDAYSATATRATVRASTRLTVMSLDHGLSIPQVAEEARRRPQVISEVPSGVDAERFHPGQAPEVRARYRIPAGAPLAILCAGLDRAHTFKRVDHAIEAVRDLRDRDLHLLVVGDGELRAGLADFARELEVHDRVHFAGRVSNAELPDHYRAADLHLLCSDRLESFGLVQVEAMATEVPVIICSLPGPREVSDDGVHGYHFTPGDVDDLRRAIAQLLDLPEADRRAMGAAGRRRVLQRYTWDASVSALEDAFAAALRDAA